jgi:hypothetical protein
MVRRILAWSGTAVVCLGAALLVFGAMSGGSCGCVLASGRTVQVSSDGWWLSMSTTPDTAIIKSTGIHIVVAPTQIQINGQTLAALKTNATLVNVSIDGNQVILVADGVPVPIRR